MTLWGPDGRELAPARRGRTLASAYEAASLDHQDLATWQPLNYSGQAGLSLEREVIAARVHDIARNDGWASAAMDRLVDNVIGAGWRLSAHPNPVSLGIDPEEADALADQIEAEWEDYCNDPGFFCDVGRRSTMGGILALAFRHRVMDGEAVSALYWKERGGPYATCVQVIDPDRLSMPMGQIESETLRAGVEMDDEGAPIAYHFRKAHPGDFLPSPSQWQWERVARATDWGRPLIVHAFEAKRAGDVRGQSPLSPILRKLKQVTRYDEAELQAAILNAVLAGFIESPHDHDELAEGLGGGELTKYQEERLAFHGAKPLRLPGVSMNFLYPGEKVNLTTPGHPNAVYEAFERTALRNVASALGLSYEQLSMDWSQVNYSSARAALLEVWRGFSARKGSFAAQYTGPIYAAWLEEAIDIGRIRLPAGAPPFETRRSAYCRADWIGPGRGWVDPQKEADAAATRLDAGLSTLERECAEQGLDWKSVALQRGRERRFLNDQGLNPDQPLRPTQTRDQPAQVGEAA